MELSLQVDFLEARDGWLDQTTSTGTTGNNNSSNDHTSRSSKIPPHQHSSSEQLLDTIERYRTR